MTLAEFVQTWFKDYAERELAPKTIERYKVLSKRITQGLGMLTLAKIQPTHIVRFINNLAETGIRNDSKLVLNEVSRNCLSKGILADKGVNKVTIARILKGQTTDYKAASKIAVAFDKQVSDMFTVQNTDGKLSSQTLLHHFRLLHTILNAAVHWNLLLSNPAERVKPPRVEKKQTKSLDDIEVAKMFTLFESEPLKYQVAVYVAVLGGLRVGEVVGLKWSDVNFDTGSLSITKARQYTKDRGNFEKSPKNESSKRIIKLPVVALLKLQELRKEQLTEKLSIGSKWVDSGNIFIQWDGTPIFYGTVGHWFKKWISTTDLTQITFHGLRHSNASMLIAHGADIATVSKRLGHSRISTTTDIYTHVINKMDEEAANTLDRIFLGERVFSAKQSPNSPQK